VSKAQEVRYLSSHLGFSPLGLFLTICAIPWFVMIALVIPYIPSVLSVPAVAVALIPSGIWIIGIGAGPSRLPWFYRPPGTCTFTEAGIDLKTQMAGNPQSVHVQWHDVAGVERRGLRMCVINQTGDIAAHIRADLTRLRPPGVSEDWSFAQALVAYRPTDYVLTDFVALGQPAGARQRESGDPVSLLVPATLSRANLVAIAISAVVIFLVAFAAAVLRSR
jgi:hypothetical protein